MPPYSFQQIRDVSSTPSPAFSSSATASSASSVHPIASLLSSSAHSSVEQYKFRHNSSAPSATTLERRPESFHPPPRKGNIRKEFRRASLSQRQGTIMAEMSTRRFASQSPPTHMIAPHPHAGTGLSRHVSQSRGNGYSSPRAQLAPIHGMPQEENPDQGDGQSHAKRRRTDDPGRSSAAEVAFESDGQHRHNLSNYQNAARPAAPRSGASSAAFPHSGPPPVREYMERYPSGPENKFDERRIESAAREQRILGGDDSIDASLPLARRRGDAAQAKASRLHIDTGYSTESHDSLQNQQYRERESLGLNPPFHGSARSAPPHKMTFAERERGLPPSVSLDPRDGRAQAAFGTREQGPYYSGVSSRRPTIGEPIDAAHGWESVHARRDPSMASNAQAASAYRGVPGQPVSTPLTAARASAFLPQTATLPSPAYHSTQFSRHSVSGHNPPYGPPGASSAPQPQASGNGAAPSVQGQGGPRTAGLGGPTQPMTARLPDHMRSPPASKTQFLSLFSNFFDSLNDSRTLKATLEDQVRRSNTLLQTLQRSARVLELTVDRRMQEERTVWEAKIEALEARCRRLESKTNAGSPTPPLEQSTNGTSHSPQQGREQREQTHSRSGSRSGPSQMASPAQAAHSRTSSSSSRPGKAAEGRGEPNNERAEESSA